MMLNYCVYSLNPIDGGNKRLRVKISFIDETPAYMFIIKISFYVQNKSQSILEYFGNSWCVIHAKSDSQVYLLVRQYYYLHLGHCCAI